MVGLLYYNDTGSNSLEKYAISKEQYEDEGYGMKDMILVSGEETTEDLKKALLDLHKENFEEAMGGGFKITRGNIDQIIKRLESFALARRRAEMLEETIFFMKQLKEDFAMTTKKKNIKRVSSGDSGPKKIILYVDDNLTTHRHAKLGSEDLGYQFLSAENGLEALDLIEQMKIQKRKIKVIFLDNDMPIMGGVEFLKK